VSSEVIKETRAILTGNGLWPVVSELATLVLARRDLRYACKRTWTPWMEVTGWDTPPDGFSYVADDYGQFEFCPVTGVVQESLEAVFEKLDSGVRLTIGTWSAMDTSQTGDGGINFDGFGMRGGVKFPDGFDFGSNPVVLPVRCRYPYTEVAAILDTSPAATSVLFSAGLAGAVGTDAEDKVAAYAAALIRRCWNGV
jgi:hypothetical protein